MSVLRDNLDIAVAAQVIISGAIFRIERLPAEVVGPGVDEGLLSPSQLRSGGRTSVRKL